MCGVCEFVNKNVSFVHVCACGACVRCVCGVCVCVFENKNFAFVCVRVCVVCACL